MFKYIIAIIDILVISATVLRLITVDSSDSLNFMSLADQPVNLQEHKGDGVSSA